jgi:4a-hydroxytetrahydrobiopterin dehydratase
MSTEDQALTNRRCVPCEGGVPRLSREECKPFFDQTPEWTLNDDASIISRKWVATEFMEVIRFFNAIAQLAEEEGHHPDLHLTGYRHACVEITTHAIGGLSENDFILAAKIDQIPIQEKRKRPNS